MKKYLLMMTLALLGGVTQVRAEDNLYGSWDGWASPTLFDYSSGDGKCTVSLAASTNYTFKFVNGSSWMGNNGTMTSDNRIGWLFESSGGNCTLTTTIAGDYEFIVKWIDSKPYISVIYPVSNQYTVHFKKGDAWSSVYAHRYVYLSGNTLDLTSWPGDMLSENSNNSGYYDVTFSDSYNYIVFNDNGSDTNKSGNVAIDFGYPETWVTDNATIQTSAPEGWVGYTRDVTNGNFGTICLPFAATITGAVVYKITGKVMAGETLTGINLESVDALEAGKTYIFRATSSTLTATYSGTYTAASADYGMMGNLSSTPVTVAQGNYVVNSNKLRKVTGDAVTVGQYRGYVTLEGVGVASARGENFISFVDDSTTGIETVNTQQFNADEAFDLQGRRVNVSSAAKGQKGIYILNGKKYIVK